MKVKKGYLFAAVIALAMVLSVAGAQPNLMPTLVLAESAEAQAVGGMSCASVWGFGIAVGIATLSGCGILCGTIAWYSLLALNSCE